MGNWKYNFDFGTRQKSQNWRLSFSFPFPWKQEIKTTHWPFSIFDFQNIENRFAILCFLETKIDNWDCKFVIFNSLGIKHWKSWLWIFDFQFSIWNKNQIDENHTDPRRAPSCFDSCHFRFYPPFPSQIFLVSLQFLFFANTKIKKRFFISDFISTDTVSRSFVSHE